MPELDLRDDSSASDDDFETDEDVEKQSDHEDEELRWSPPKNWEETSATDTLLKQCGEAVWKAPADRESIPSEDIGLKSDPQFEARASSKFIDLLLDALPLIAFFKNILVAESIRYGKTKAEDMSPHSRGFDPKLFTVANFLRLFACVIMKGLVQAKDDPTLFRTERRDDYVRTGAEAVTAVPTATTIHASS